ncbi:hypothetical protein GOBAR_AA15807 [Gossypium barbadense]|uniref:Uncharacterized protein n=1 Tax=Gossypium barbadense TaxID=3634 RepID=A0A2P5XNF0_GOSBA|nr:hypothetical protein GOBAR_AA15807 [Gossypium barbadense]
MGYKCIQCGARGGDHYRCLRLKKESVRGLDWQVGPLIGCVRRLVGARRARARGGGAGRGRGARARARAARWGRRGAAGAPGGPPRRGGGGRGVAARWWGLGRRGLAVSWSE